MTYFDFFVWLLFIGVTFGLMALIEGLLVAASKPAPPINTLHEETLCDNCVDLLACSDENCPYDWVDFGIEVTD